MSFDLKEWLRQRWAALAAETRRVVIAGAIFLAVGIVRTALGYSPSVGPVYLGSLLDAAIGYAAYRLVK